MTLSYAVYGHIDFLAPNTANLGFKSYIIFLKRTSGCMLQLLTHYRKDPRFQYHKICTKSNMQIHW